MRVPATRKNDPPNASPDSGGSIKVTAAPGADRATLLARTALRPSVRAAVTTQIFSKQFGELDINALVDQLVSHATAVNNGDLQRPEAMLVAQANTLEAIFHELARRAAVNMGEYLDAAETYLRLALKAQSQCRATIETLAEIKNPKPVAFVQQANIAHGPQQVNNTPEASRAGNPEIQQSKLLEQQRNEWMDTRAPGAAVGADQDLATLDKVHGSQDAGG